MEKEWAAYSFDYPLVKALYEVKASDLHLRFKIFRLGHSIKINSIKLQSVDPYIYSFFIF